MTDRPSDVHSPSAWLDAYQENQKQMVQAHETFQRTLTQGFEAFMQAMTHSQQQLARVMTHLEAPATQPKAERPALTHAPRKPIAPAPTRAPSTTSANDLSALLLDVVAQKTGYPVETLEMDMSLEDDLGVDSIKRVEILSTLRDEHPELPEVSADAMGGIETLQDVLDHLRQSTHTTPVVESPAAPSDTSEDFDVLLLDVVAQKTGYPVETLEMDMSLEDDLGVDSIKRVEILSTLRDLLPNLPEADADRMSTLETLSDIVSFLKTSLA